MELGQVIRQYREQKGWSQEQLAKKCYISRTTVTHAELGTVQPKVLRKIADALTVPVSTLLLEALEDTISTADKLSQLIPVSVVDKMLDLLLKD